MAQSVCPACREAFAADTTADRHRVGKHGPERTCLTPEAMRARGWNQDTRGRWRGAPRQK